MSMKLEGYILKGIGGFYYVETSEGIFECKAKGKFRKERIVPLPGDKVSITVRDLQENTIDHLYERKNKLIRPPVANIDKLMIVVSVAAPLPNPLVIDKLTVIAEKNSIEPVIIVTKADLDEEKAEELVDIYTTTGYRTYTFSSVDKRNLNLIREEFTGCLTALTGNSGAGKSTLLNAIDQSLNLPTGEISNKLGRGRHTTRQAEIFKVADGMVIDTAGFSSIEFSGDNMFLASEVENYFTEFKNLIHLCRFNGCCHINTKGCAVIDAVEKGEISRSRYDSYISIYDELKDIKSWQMQ